MKILLTLISLLGIYSSSFSQTNTFPLSGSVGIGTMSPENGWKLDVNGLGTIGTSGSARLYLGTVNPTTAMIQSRDLSINQKLSFFASSYNFDIGNVGIGTSDPQFKLDVVGEISSYHVGIGQSSTLSSVKNYVNLGCDQHASLLLSSNLYLSGNNTLKFAKTHSTLAGSAILMPGNTQSNQGSILFYTNQPGAVTASAEFTNSAAMVIAGDGNVGIGTTSPTGKLSVNGEIRAKEIKVEATNWPDYVFDDNHKKMSLAELDLYIKKNKHLPDVPTAKEVEKEGIALGEMNKRLLLKIEELTLHLIEKDEQLKAQQSKLELQNIRIDKLEQLLNQVIKDK